MINRHATENQTANVRAAHKKSSWKEPWFWFVLGPLMLTIATSLVFIYIAVNGADQRVVDDYYTEGKTINHRFEADKLAVSLGVTAAVKVDLVSGEAIVDLSGLTHFPDALTLYFSHPVKSSEDITIQLKKINTSRYRSDLPKVLHGRWYLQLAPIEPTAVKKWRLEGELDLNLKQEITLSPEVQ